MDPVRFRRRWCAGTAFRERIHPRFQSSILEECRNSPEKTREQPSEQRLAFVGIRTAPIKSRNEHNTKSRKGLSLTMRATSSGKDEPKAFQSLMEGGKPADAEF